MTSADSKANGNDANGDDKPSGLQGVRVLIVEDGWHVADALKVSLQKLGMVVAGPVATTEAARRLVNECTPELALVDVNLKGELAFGLIDWLHDRGVRIVVISGYGDLPQSLEEFAAILHKPFTATALLATLRRVMSRDQNQ
jgi:DNA-binding response OmpR family regulator